MKLGVLNKYFGLDFVTDVEVRMGEVEIFSLGNCRDDC